MEKTGALGAKKVMRFCSMILSSLPLKLQAKLNILTTKNRKRKSKTIMTPRRYTYKEELVLDPVTYKLENLKDDASMRTVQAVVFNGLIGEFQNTKMGFYLKELKITLQQQERPSIKLVGWTPLKILQLMYKRNKYRRRNLNFSSQFWTSCPSR